MVEMSIPPRSITRCGRCPMPGWIRPRRRRRVRPWATAGALPSMSPTLSTRTSWASPGRRPEGLHPTHRRGPQCPHDSSRSTAREKGSPGHSGRLDVATDIESEAARLPKPTVEDKRLVPYDEGAHGVLSRAWDIAIAGGADMVDVSLTQVTLPPSSTGGEVTRGNVVRWAGTADKHMLENARFGSGRFFGRHAIEEGCDDRLSDRHRPVPRGVIAVGVRFDRRQRGTGVPVPPGEGQPPARQSNTGRHVGWSGLLRVRSRGKDAGARPVPRLMG